jgi:beta-galactosidase
MNFKSLLTICILQISFFTGFAQKSQSISLVGQWQFSLDPQNVGEKENWSTKILTDKISLPGTTDEAHYGTKTVGSDYGILTRAYKYVGPAWYQREFVVNKADANKEFELYLDRVLWESKVWVDGRYCDLQDGLGVPHVHRLGKLASGKHILTLRINNDLIHNIGDKGHAYSEYMQSIWNGAVGRIELRALEAIHVSSIKTWPNVDKNELRVSISVENSGKSANTNFRYKLIDLASGETVLTEEKTNACPIGKSDVSINLRPTKTIKKWNEFSPNMYRLVVETGSGKSVEVQQADFGFRKVTASKSKVLINDRPVFLRGNLDCVHFPLTGYPSCDPVEWVRIFKIYKTYGLNHVRFHSWCPPEAAFVAADRMGMYLQVEILWIDWWMTSAPKDRPDMLTKGLPEGLGKNPSADAFVQAEMERMINAYGNHPSFTMFCIGNELGNSDFTVMEKWVAKMKAADNRRLYAVSTARTITPTDQYCATHNIPNIGGTYGVRGYTTDYDLEENYSKANIPIIAHELGQYPVYPLWSEIDKYTGVLKARNLEECRESARKNHLLEMNRPFHEASGALQNLLYKAHIENQFRTPSCAGFQLLSMADYQGQGEALVGWLDCFWDAKGNTMPESFRRYCNAVVPLARFKKFVWETNETFEARLQVANYGAEALISKAHWTLTSASGGLIEQGVINEQVVPQGGLKDLGQVAVKLDRIREAGKYTFSITLEGTEYHNSWDLWVYPPVQPEVGDVFVASEFSDEVQKKLEQGGKVLLLANQLGTTETARPINFTPLFWSTVFFPGQSNTTLGLYVNKNHPALSCFPTDTYSDYQWEKISQGQSFVLSAYPGIIPIAQPISDFHINDKLGSIFECKVGNGKLMVCGYNITNEKNPVARQMKFNLLKYMNQQNFNPTFEIKAEELKTMLYYVRPVTSQAPKGFEKALLYVKCGGSLQEDGSRPWQKELDQILAQKMKCDYTIACTDVWKDEKGSSWTGGEMTLTIETPKGLIGDLYVKFVDANKQHRTGSIWFEGREMKLDKHEDADGKWVKIFVMREDTNDGKIVLKTKATQGGNLMMSEVGFVAE